MIRLRRMDGTPKEVGEFKKGKAFRNLREADTELWHIAGTVPPGEHHRVAYTIEDGDPSSVDYLYLTGSVNVPTRWDVMVKPLDLYEAIAGQYGYEIADRVPK